MCSYRYIRSERSVILINFCLSIISSNALILIGQTQTRNKVKNKSKKKSQLGPIFWLNFHYNSCIFFFRLAFQVLCTLIAAFLHFFFLSSFCWVLTEAWQSYMAVTGRLRNRIIRKRFLCLGWGGRLVYSSLCLIFTLTSFPFNVSLYSPLRSPGSSGGHLCWIHQGEGIRNSQLVSMLFYKMETSASEGFNAATLRMAEDLCLQNN